jgi:hypothetical protein
MDKLHQNPQLLVVVILALGIYSLTACTISPRPVPVEVMVTMTPSSQPTESPKATPTSVPTAIPTKVAEVIQVEKTVPLFDQFIQDIKTGEKNKIVGLWVEGKMALTVVYQPASNPGFVSTVDNVATYFLLPYKMAGNYGMLAHNYLAGRFFFNMTTGDIIQLVFGDGDYQDFEVVDIKEYQALQPNSPRSDYINLVSGAQLTANNLFYEVYMGDFHTTLQTCIAQGIEDSWGRRFVLAPPL